MSWVNTVDTKGGKAAIATAGLAGLIPSLVYLDSIYARASDLNSLQAIVTTSIVDTYEREIGIIDEKIIQLDSLSSLTAYEKGLLARQKTVREQYLRKLDRLKDDPSLQLRQR